MEGKTPPQRQLGLGNRERYRTELGYPIVAEGSDNEHPPVFRVLD